MPSRRFGREGEEDSVREAPKPRPEPKADESRQLIGTCMCGTKVYQGDSHQFAGATLRCARCSRA